MPSSELLRCNICGREFETIESLNEHTDTEKEDKRLRNIGFDDG